MTRRKLRGVIIECVMGDIAQQADMDAVVNATNADLRSGGGVAGALHHAAGPQLAEECRPFAPIRPGQAIVTGAFGLPNRYVIHCLGPVFGRDEPADSLLASCYRNALYLAEQKRLSSIAFPAISTGAFGYPMNSAASVALETIADELPRLSSVRHIRMVLFDQPGLQLHAEMLIMVADRLT